MAILLLGWFVCFEKSTFKKLFQSSGAAFGCSPAEGWGMAVVSCIPASQQDLGSSRKVPQPRTKPCPHMVHHCLRRADISLFSHKTATHSPLCPSEAQSEVRSRNNHLQQLQASQIVPAHSHCWMSLWSLCPCSHEFRVDSNLSLSYLCQP